jgi:murein DD-endopeptidase MepM/ murein hydrolase activator NlpD
MTIDHPRGASLRRPDTEFAARIASRATRVLRDRRRAVTWSGGFAAGIVAVAACAAGYLHYADLAANERVAAIHAETANAALQDELGKMRDELGAIKGRVAALSTEQQNLEAGRKAAPAPDTAAAPPKATNTAQLSHALDQAQKELHLTEAQRVTLMARLSKAEAEAQSTADQSQKRMQQLEAERDALKARLAKLEQKNSMRGQPDAGPSAAAAPAAAASQPAPAHAQPAAKAEATIVLPRGAKSPVGEVEKVLASAGVDVARLFSQFGVSRGEGGPFVPVPRGSVAPRPTLTPERLAALRTMMKTLPVTAPLAVDYEVGSPFGVRHDPFNGRTSFHTGLDMDAPYDSKVFATAPGTVTYAGYRDDYGKIVEIDHGHGITTRYAHLHQYTVSVGQHVAAHQQIGYLGSTGRATGPHVHYEVLVNGEPQDPTKFLQLGHIVPVAATR